MTAGRHRVPGPGGASYSDAVIVDAGELRWVYVAGQTPRATGPHGDVPHDLKGQTELCFAQIAAILESLDAGLGDVVQITAYLTSLDNYSEFAAVRAAFFGDEPPSSAVVGVASLLDAALVEIAAVAVTSTAA